MANDETRDAMLNAIKAGVARLDVFYKGSMPADTHATVARALESYANAYAVLTSKEGSQK